MTFRHLGWTSWKLMAVPKNSLRAYRTVLTHTAEMGPQSAFQRDLACAFLFTSCIAEAACPLCRQEAPLDCIPFAVSLRALTAVMGLAVVGCVKKKSLRQLSLSVFGSWSHIIVIIYAHKLENSCFFSPPDWKQHLAASRWNNVFEIINPAHFHLLLARKMNLSMKWKETHVGGSPLLLWPSWCFSVGVKNYPSRHGTD